MEGNFERLKSYQGGKFFDYPGYLITSPGTALEWKFEIFRLKFYLFAELIDAARQVGLATVCGNRLNGLKVIVAGIFMKFRSA